CGVGLCADPVECAVPATLTLSTPEISFGVRAFSTSSSIVVVTTNTGSVTAESISGALTSAQFNFLGGAYPGDGGTCKTSLAPGDSCTLVLSFTAPGPPAAAQTSTL